MNLLGTNPLRTIRERIGAAIGVFAISFVCCLVGVGMTFFLAPRQAMQANRISNLPVVSLADVEAATTGDTVLITGVVNGTPPHPEIVNFVAYAGEKWVVTVPDPNELDSTTSEPTGSWESFPTVLPDLFLEMEGQLVPIHAASTARLDGALHELTVPGASTLSAKDGVEPITDGTIRYHGLDNGVLTTVLGVKASDEGVTPEQIFAGDRAAFEESQHQAASGFLISGICMFILAPLVLFGGLTWVVFKRR